jgi:hypothetical protein
VTPPRGIKVGALKPNWEDPTFPAAPPVPRGVKPVKGRRSGRHAEKIVAQSNIEDPKSAP